MQIFSNQQRLWGVYFISYAKKSRLIEGLVFIQLDGMELPFPTQLENCRITPIGIDYLCDNSFMEKAKSFLKDIKEIVTFT